MRGSFLSGNYAEGDRLAKQHLQPVKRNFGTNLALCELEFSFDLPVEGMEEDGLRFRRELDLEHAVIRSECQYPGGYTLFREAIASHADDVIAARIWSGQPGGVSFTLGAGAERIPSRSAGWTKIRCNSAARLPSRYTVTAPAGMG